MNKTELLFRMMEQPHNYTEAQWQEVLSNEECRELYKLMSKTQSAFDLQKEITDEEIDAEWQQLECEQQNASPSSNSECNQQKKTSFFSLYSLFTKVAAMFVGLLMLSGLAYAAIHFWRTSTPAPKNEETELTQTKDTVKATSALSSPESEPEAPYVFDNVSLDKIAREIANFHHLNLELQNERASQLRFYFVWKKQDNLQTVIEQLNQFESVNIAVENGKLLVR